MKRPRPLVMKLHGVRGSRPVHSPEFLLTGGNTTCVEFDTKENFHLIIDGGTGLAKMGYALEQPLLRKRFHILITHTHWDHVVTIPHFMPLFDPDAHITFYATDGSNGKFSDIFARLFDLGHLPRVSSNIRAKIDFETVHAGKAFLIEGHIRVEGFQLNHQAITLGYKVSCGTNNVVVITDNAPTIKGNFLGDGMTERAKQLGDDRYIEEFRSSLVSFLKNVHTLVYDTHFNDHNLKPDWGHSTPGLALQLCQEAGIKRLLMFHHAPEDNDREVIEKMQAIHSNALAAGIEVVNAREEDEWDLKSA